MNSREYSAGIVKCSFWFAEFRKVIQLLNDGNSMDEIKSLNQDSNIFSAVSSARATQIFKSVSSRVSHLDNSLIQLFRRNELATQKLIVLISIMNTDRLFFEFVHEVYFEQIVMGNIELPDRDLRIFFKNKQVQSEKVAGWSDYTLKRLGDCYKTLLTEAGILDHTPGNRKIIKHIFNMELEHQLKHQGMAIYVRILTGVSI